MSQVFKSIRWRLAVTLIRWLLAFTRQMAELGIWWLLGVLFLATMLWAGYFVTSGEIHENPLDVSRPGAMVFIAMLHGLVASMQFIVLEGDLPQPLNAPEAGWITWGLYVMQVLLPLMAAFSAIAALFREQILAALFRYGTSRLEEHSIVIGMGRVGKAVVKAAQVRSVPVVAVDREGRDRLENLVEERNNNCVPVILAENAAVEGDGQRTLFRHLGCGRARMIFLALPDQQMNLQILEGLKECSPNEAIIYLRTHSGSMYRLLSDWLSLDMCKGLDVRPFDPHQIAARGIVNLYSPDLYAATDRKGPISQTIMIVGASELASALVLRFARTGIYAPVGKLKIFWRGVGAEDAYADLLRQYPALAPISSLDRWCVDDTGSESYLKEVLPPVDIEVSDVPATECLAQAKVEPAAIYICLDDEVEGLALARDLQTQLGGLDMGGEPRQRLILVAASEKPARLRTSIGSTSPSGKDVIEFARYRIEECEINAFTAETLLGDRADGIAKQFKMVYDNKTEIDESDWRACSFFEKESNRDAADHLAIKARYAGLDPKDVSAKVFEENLDVPLGSAADAFVKNADDLIIMEQKRYRAFMFMMGFRHGRANNVCVQGADDELSGWPSPSMKSLERTLRVNRTLLVKELPEDERKKDANIIETSLKVLQRNSVRPTDMILNVDNKSG